MTLGANSTQFENGYERCLESLIGYMPIDRWPQRCFHERRRNIVRAEGMREATKKRTKEEFSELLNALDLGQLMGIRRKLLELVGEGFPVELPEALAEEPRKGR